jgi:hypothetical protein
MAKQVFDKSMFAEIWPKLCAAPITQVSEEVQEELRDFDFEKATSLEVFIFCSELSSRAFATHDISSFVRVLFDVSNYYERPTE